MNIFTLMKHARLMAPVDTAVSTGGTTPAAPAAPADRGDDFVPTADDDDETAPPAKAAAKTTDEAMEEEAEALGLDGSLKAGEKKTAAKGDDEAEDEDGAKPKKDTRIPLNRHKEIVESHRAAREAAEQEVARLKEGKAVAATNEQIAELEAKVDKLEDDYAEALLEGEKAKASALRKEIRTLTNDITEQKVNFRSQMATAVAVEQVQFQHTVERLEAAYPVLKEGSDEFDAGTVASVLELHNAYMATGIPAGTALQKAVNMVLKPVTAKQVAATTVTPRADADEVAAEAAKLERAAAARKRNAAAAEATPPNAAKAGANSDEAGGLLDAKRLATMKFDEFTKIDDATVARLRGDTL